MNDAKQPTRVERAPSIDARRNGSRHHRPGRGDSRLHAPSPVISFPRPRLAHWLALMLVLVSCSLGPCRAQGTDERSATVNGEVDAGRWKGILLKRLPRGASLGVKIRVDGGVGLLLLVDREFRRFPGEVEPAFASQVVDRMGITMKVPESGDYYLLVDNRDGKETRHFTITITAAPAKD